VRNWRTPRRLKILFAAAIAILLLNSVIPVLLLARYHFAEEWHTHTHEVLASIFELRSHLLSAESSQRTFVLTAENSHLNEFNEQVFLVNQSLNRLHEMTVDNRAQQSRVALLAPMIEKRVATMRSVLQVAQTSGTEVAIEHLRDGSGRQAMQELVNVVDVMRDDERRLASQREREANRFAALGAISFVIVTLFNLLLFWLTYHLLVRRYGGRLDAMVNAAMDGVVGIDQNARVVLFNPAAEQMFGRIAKDVVGGPVTNLMSSEQYQMLEARLQRTAEADRTANGGLVALSGRRANGTGFPIEATVSTTGFGSGELQVAVLRDVTARHLAEQQLQESFARQKELSLRLMEAEEAERRNINRELHDRIGQNLSALMITAELMRSGLPAGDKVSTGRINDIQDLLRSTTDQVRNVMADLRPPALDDYGLAAALEVYAGPVAERTGMEVHIDGGGLNCRPQLVIETALFRIAQEALNNIAKHSRAVSVDICILGNDEKVQMTIQDDGIGFDAQEKSTAPSWGMKVMQERAAAVGGTLRLTSAPGEGTCVQVNVEYVR